MSKSQQFQNETIAVDVKQEPGCLVKMNIKANQKAAADNWAKALRNVKKEVSFPGYRKGKAPDQMILKNYEKQVEKEFRDTILNDSAHQAMVLAKLFPWNREGRIKADIVTASKESGGEFTLEFESYPTIPDLAPESLTVEKVETKPTSDQDVEDHILSLQYYHAKKNPVEGRDTIENDDYVEVTVKMVDGDLPERKTTFHVNNTYLQDWLYKSLLGKKVGETFAITPPKPEKKGTLTEANIVEQLSDPKPFNISPHKISQAELEEVNEEFAKKYGSDNLEEFKKKVRGHLEKQVEEEAKSQFQERIQETLAETSTFDIPASIFAEEKGQSMKKIIENFKMAQYSDQEIQEMKETIEGVASRHAKKALVTHYVLSKIAEEKRFEVTQNEVIQELIRESMANTGMVDPAVFQNLENYAAPIARRLQFVKAMEYLANHVRVK